MIITATIAIFSPQFETPSIFVTIETLSTFHVSLFSGDVYIYNLFFTGKQEKQIVIPLENGFSLTCHVVCSTYFMPLLNK